MDVFAERGFHRTRVSDIAKHAGVAYGLIYHYFDSKDAVLHAIFEDNWAVFIKVLEDLQSAKDRPTSEKLSSIIALLIDALRVAPALIQVIIQEVSRSDRFVHATKLEAFQRALGVVREILADGQRRGEVKASLDPQVGAFVFFGALELVCTGFTVKAIPCSTDDEAARVKQSVTDALLGGMLEAPVRAAPKRKNR